MNIETNKNRSYISVVLAAVLGLALFTPAANAAQVDVEFVKPANVSTIGQIQVRWIAYNKTLEKKIGFAPGSKATFPNMFTKTTQLFRITWTPGQNSSGRSGRPHAQIMDFWLDIPDGAANPYIVDLPAHLVTFQVPANSGYFNIGVTSSRNVGAVLLNSAQWKNDRVTNRIGAHSASSEAKDISIPMLDGIYTVFSYEGNPNNTSAPAGKTNYLDYPLSVGGDVNATITVDIEGVN